MDNDSNKKIYGVLGFPVRHSLSPAMHNAAFKALNINAEYKLFEIKPQELTPFLNSLKQKDIIGLNVTIPYKEKITAYLNNISEDAKLIGAVNTVKLTSQGLDGFNTDGEGFLKHLTEDLMFAPKDKVISIIGAGGASRAISVYLGRAGVARLNIYDLDKARLSALVKSLKDNFKNIDIRQASSIGELNIKNCDLLINATPVGMKLADPCLVNATAIRQHLLVYDLIYNPKETKLLKLAKENGARTSNGLGMLLYQGMAAFAIWTGRRPPKEVMQKALEEEQARPLFRRSDV
jgi:shikimate dehydrogenase